MKSHMGLGSVASDRTSWRNYSESRLLTIHLREERHCTHVAGQLLYFIIITIMVFYEPGVTSHNLPRDPFKVRVHVPNVRMRSHPTLVMRRSSADRMDFDSLS
jgi:hypothetical protein